MCACDNTYVCSRCRETPYDPGYADWLDVPDPLEALSEPVGAVLTPSEAGTYVR